MVLILGFACLVLPDPTIYSRPCNGFFISFGGTLLDKDKTFFEKKNLPQVSGTHGNGDTVHYNV